MSLRSAFLGGHDVGVTARDIFTDRSGEQEAFQESLIAMHEQAEENDRLVGVMSGPRRNLLVYYGVGGIGKTSLSHRLQQTFIDEAPPDALRVAVRIDFEDAASADIEAVVLRLRAALGQLGPAWRSFDLAFASYWSSAHAGEPLNEFLDRTPIVGSLARRFSVGDQMADVLAHATDVPLGGLSGLAQWGLLEASRVVRKRVAERKLLTDCPLFETFVSATVDHETASFLPHLLAWDLAQFNAKGTRAEVVVFLDTFERVTHELSASFHRQLQRIIYLMPNVLFVATGRNRIDWAEEREGSEIDYTGPTRWPNLHYENTSPEPRQHLIGYLADSDAESYLTEVVTRDSRPAMSDQIRARIIAGARGLPLYLDLSVAHFVSIVGGGQEPRAEDFGGPLVAVVTRSMRDLPDDERELARAAALVERYDEDLLLAAIPSCSPGRVRRFLTRPFQTVHPNAIFNYSMHGSMREAILQADPDLQDGWSSRDRAEVSSRIFAALGQRAQSENHPHGLSDILEVGVRVAARNHWFDEWLVSSTLRLVDAGSWGRLPVVLNVRANQGNLGALQGLVQGILLRRAGQPHQSVNILDQALRRCEHERLLQSALAIHRAHSLRNLGDYRRAHDTYEAELNGPRGREAQLWIGDYAYLNGHFQAAQAPARACAGDDGLGREASRLEAHILRVNARFVDAADKYEELAEKSRSAADIPALIKALVGLSQTVCWQGQAARVQAIQREVSELLELIPNSVEGVKMAQAVAIAAIQADHGPTTRQLVDEIRRLAEVAQYPGGHNLHNVAQILERVRGGDTSGARRAIQSLQRRTAKSGGNTYWVPITNSWVTDPESTCDVSPLWLDGAEETMNRWKGVVSQ